MRSIPSTCVPCEGGIPPLSRTEAQESLVHAPKWDLADDAKSISRRFTFKNFAHALSFVNQIGALAEQEGHHPDISFGWGYVEVTLTTHAVNGLSDNDLVLAKKIDEIEVL